MNLPALWRCIQCGECCRHLVGQKFGMAVTPEEKRRLETLARRRGINVHFLPLTWNGFKVTLYQFADEVCPFLRNNRCSIYQWRPLACRMYPVHPYGVSECTMLNRLQRRGFQVIFPPQVEAAGKKYAATVIPLIQDALKRYDLNRGWESPYPLHFKHRLTYGRIPV